MSCRRRVVVGLHFEMYSYYRRQRIVSVRGIVVERQWTYELNIDVPTELFLLGCSHLLFPLTFRWFRRDGGGV